MPSDLYATLEVSRTASAEEIKKAYRKLARRHHPDANPGDKEAEERFKQVQNAYDVLSDADKRKQYDTFGAAWSADGRRAGPGGVHFEQFDLGDLGGLAASAIVFSSLFGGGGGARTLPLGQGRRHRGDAQPLLRGLVARGRDARSGRGGSRLLDLRRLGSQAGHLAQDLPPVWRSRRRRREPGPVRHLATLPDAAAAAGMIIEQPLPDLPRLRPRAPHQAVQGQDPGRGQGRYSHPSQGQGRARAQRRPARRPLRGHARGALAAVRAPRRRPRRRGAGHLPRGRARRYGCRYRLPTARSRSRSRPVPSRASCCACAATAPPSSRARAAATCSRECA